MWLARRRNSVVSLSIPFMATTIASNNLRRNRRILRVERYWNCVPDRVSVVDLDTGAVLQSAGESTVLPRSISGASVHQRGTHRVPITATGSLT
jgi:hypothetical protein